LTTILTYHVLEGQQSANTITNAYSAISGDVLVVDTVLGEPLSVQIDPTGVILLTGNGTTVGVPDIFAQNGVIHALPAVLIPPSLLDDNGRVTFGNLSTVVDFVAGSPDFSILASLLTEQGLIEALSDTSADFTVFAPTNGAFQAAQGTLDTLSAEQVTTALTFHVVPGRYTAADLRALYSAEADGVLELETLSGETLTIQVEADGTILMNGQGITVFLTDQTRDNGIVHGIPAVMIPPSLQ
jgi:transforming growth factor-beta-induced protein